MFFKVILQNNEIHVLPGTPKTFEELFQMIVAKFHKQLPDYFSLRYKDSDDELVLMTSNDDFQTAISAAEAEKLRNLRIVVKQETSPNYLSKNKVLTAAAQEASPGTLKNNLDNRFKEIPLTSSLTEIPAAEDDEVVNPEQDKNSIENSKVLPFKGLAEIGETISNFCSPIVDIGKEGRNFTFNRQETQNIEGTNNSNDNQEKPSPFTKEQMEVIMQLIDQSVNKNLMEKLEGIMSEALGGGMENSMNNSRYSMGMKKSFNHLPLSSPFGGRISTKRCRELVQSENSVCCECKDKIQNVRYSCLSCKNYDCCEKCEDSVEHPHPLLKIKAQKQQEPDLSQSITMTRSQVVSRPRVQEDNSQRIGSVVQPQQQKLADGSSALPSNSSAEKKASPESKAPQQMNNSQAPSSQMNSSQIGKPEMCDISEFRRYKVTVVKEPVYDIIRVKAGGEYNVDYTIKNTGHDTWPEDICLVCTQGVHKGFEYKIPSLAPGKEHNVNFKLVAPNDCGRFISQWKLHYCENDVFKSFGRVTYIEIDVCPADKDSGQKSFDSWSFDESKKEKKKEWGHHINEQDQQLMNETGCTEQVLKNAKNLNDMFPGNLKEKIYFVKDCNNNDLNSLVSLYLDGLSNPGKRRGTEVDRQKFSF